MRAIDELLQAWEFSELHAIEVDAEPDRVDAALRTVSVNDVRGIRLLYALRGLGRAGRDTRRPLLGLMGIGAVVLEDVAGEGVVLGLTGRFWRFRGGAEIERPRSREEFLAYDRPEVCKAVIDFRIADLGGGRCRLTTETRVHVEDPGARRAFRRYWLVIRPFSGLTRVLFLREVRRQALLM